ncbi:MAG: succinate dehydrogenase, cytochrome b556 subunit, partial [Proteobacteria bacterium]|nr:succinate dehydrogenase, cytochrome b556 subunit [Pseudomonadota bacterium]
GVPILHRGTGLALSAGLLLLAYWLMAVASGEAAYDEASALLGSVWAKVFYTGWAFCFFYHLANGIRHLLWDMLIGLEPEQYRVSGWAVMLFTVIVTGAYSLWVIF